MKTAEQREKEFRAALAQLLEDHHAELIVTDDHQPYGMHSAICRISMESIYDHKSDTLVAEFCEFEL